MSETELKCLKDYDSALRICSSCDELFNCELGKDIMGLGDKKYNITDKVLKLGWQPLAEDLNKMSLPELRELNNALNARSRRDALKANHWLTAGCFDAGKKEWTTGGDSKQKEGFGVTPGLTVGCWDPVKKKWKTREGE